MRPRINPNHFMDFGTTSQFRRQRGLGNRLQLRECRTFGPPPDRVG